MGTYNKDAGTTNNQPLYLNATHVAQMSDTLPIDANSAALGIGRHVSGVADPFNGHIHEFRIAHAGRHRGGELMAENRVTTVLAEVLSSGGQSQALTTTVVAEVLSSIAEVAPPSSGGTRPVVIAIGS